MNIKARAKKSAEVLLARYRARGFQHARVVPRLEETHNPDRASLVLDVKELNDASYEVRTNVDWSKIGRTSSPGGR